MKSIRRWLECRAFRGEIETYLDGEARRSGERIIAHLARCARCRALADTLSAQAQAIEALPAEEDPSPGFIGRVMQRIPAAPAAVVPARTTWRPSLALVSAAALVLVAAGLWLIITNVTAPSVKPVGAQHTQVARAIPTHEPSLRPTAPAPHTRPPSRSQPGTRSAPVAPPSRVEVARAAAAEEDRDSGRSYEEDGRPDEALAAYTTARDEHGSEMARIDVAQLYETYGYTEQAVGELVEVAFAEVDRRQWEPLTVD